jgi:hypothetical protein
MSKNQPEVLIAFARQFSLISAVKIPCETYPERNAVILPPLGVYPERSRRARRQNDITRARRAHFRLQLRTWIPFPSRAPRPLPLQPYPCELIQARQEQQLQPLQPPAFLPLA